MMKLLINPAGGMAGDMFAAALVSAGADFKIMQNAMLTAGKKLGSVQIDIKQTADGSSQLSIALVPQRHHLGGNEARAILEELFSQFDICKKYRDLGMNILEILIKAEKRAHAEYNIVIKEEHTHSYSPHHHHHPSRDEETFLHEAQDIVIDIIGAVTGLQQLDIEPGAELLGPVSVGGGHVHFSHGTHSIPAPATAVILKEYNIEWKKGPVNVELFTPTGAAILAALGSPVNPAIDMKTLAAAAMGKARGSKILDIPPFELFIYKKIKKHAPIHLTF
ncbi:MAG: DUF111 family protein [Candidatus Aminicenantes bacterium]|nr:MAG: DUF111 family protein [Candidatus Aminicenantes bacterium]